MMQPEKIAARLLLSKELDILCAIIELARRQEGVQ